MFAIIFPGVTLSSRIRNSAGAVVFNGHWDVEGIGVTSHSQYPVVLGFLFHVNCG
jgi:hypothetical protein